MAIRGHISEVSSARFETAMRDSLARLESAGEVFSISDVVRNARYADGTSVGETTIYARDSNGKRVHADLLATIKAASARSRAAKAAKKTKLRESEESEAAVSSSLRRQLVEQEGRLQELETALAAVSHHLHRAQEEQYVLLAALSHLTKGAVLDVVRPLRELEAVLGDLELVGKLKDEAGELASQCSRLLRPA
jgi:hypothetical protein